jgi:hypothetical protein
VLKHLSLQQTGKRGGEGDSTCFLTGDAVLDASVCFEDQADGMAKLLVLGLLVVVAVLTYAGTYGLTASPRNNRL